MMLSGVGETTVITEHPILDGGPTGILTVGPVASDGPNVYHPINTGSDAGSVITTVQTSSNPLSGIFAGISTTTLLIGGVALFLLMKRK